MSTPTNCPNCSIKLKGLLSTSKLLDEKSLQFLRDFSNFEGNVLCDKCSAVYMKAAKKKLREENENRKSFIKKYYSTFPILTTSNPPGWEFETLGIVTAQATMNNRVGSRDLIEFIFGGNQNLVDLDKSVTSGEKQCYQLLKQKALLLIGNAIIGVDIDFTEFGLKGELMLVCMAGTAIKCNNLHTKSKDYAALKLEWDENQVRYNQLKEYRKWSQ